MNYRLTKIPKKHGKDRLICIPDKELKNKLRGILHSSLNTKQLLYCDLDIVHGFIPTRSIVTNAQKHIGFNYTLSIDLKDFFDTVTPDMVKEYLTPEEIDSCFIDGRAYQGLPTSPAIANLAAIKLDHHIKSVLDNIAVTRVAETYILKGFKVPYAYTRYADDLSISLNISPLNASFDFEFLRDEIIRMISSYGFEVNKKKTRLQSAKFGRREITGLFVDDKGVHTNSKYKHRLRAARHKPSSEKELNGLEEFAKCKGPSQYLPLNIIDYLIGICKAKYVSCLFKDANKDDNSFGKMDHPNDRKENWLNKIEALEEEKERISKFPKRVDMKKRVREVKNALLTPRNNGVYIDKEYIEKVSSKQK